jgi:hypothetical protein
LRLILNGNRPDDIIQQRKEKMMKKKKMMLKNAANSWKVVGLLVGSVIMVGSTTPIISDC